MITGYRYKAMTITGIFHLVLGIIATIFSIRIIIPLFNPGNTIYRPWLTLIVISSLWFILIGVLGIFAGKSSYTERKTQQLKIAYMVIAILSASLCFGSGFYSTTILYVHYYYRLQKDAWYDAYIVGLCLTSVEFVLAIVSSSICCCCPRHSVQGVVIMQPNQPFDFTNPTCPSHAITITSDGANEAVTYTPT